MRPQDIDAENMSLRKLYFILQIACLLPALAAAQSLQQDDQSPAETTPGNSHEFYFTRAIYSGEFDDYAEGGRWAVDYPKADHQFLVALQRLSVVDAYGSDNAVELTDPELRRHPLLYAVEVGSMSLTEAEALALK